MVSRVLENTGVMVQPGAILYKAVVHTVLFYGIKVEGLWPIQEYVWRRQAKIAEYEQHARSSNCVPGYRGCLDSVRS